jgi:hypothetical protein
MNVWWIYRTTKGTPPGMECVYRGRAWKCGRVVISWRWKWLNILDFFVLNFFSVYCRIWIGAVNSQKRRRMQGRVCRTAYVHGCECVCLIRCFHLTFSISSVSLGNGNSSFFVPKLKSLPFKCFTRNPSFLSNSIMEAIWWSWETKSRCHLFPHKPSLARFLFFHVRCFINCLVITWFTMYFFSFSVRLWICSSSRVVISRCYRATSPQMTLLSLWQYCLSHQHFSW